MKKQMTEKLNKNKGITLIALVITIIVMLILVAVTISMAVNGGLFEYAGNAGKETNNAIRDEQQLASGKVTIDNKVYNSIDEYLATKGGAGNGENDAGGDIQGIDNELFTALYTETKSYTDKNGKTAVIPKGFSVGKSVGINTIDGGLVIQDAEGNQFVWIPVEVTESDTETNIAAFYRCIWENNERSTNIMNSVYCLEPYTQGYSEEVEDYNAMLKSVYENGGFYIGRFEAGSITPRTDISNGTTQMVIKRDQYPYNYVGWGATMSDYTSDVVYRDKEQGLGAVALSKEMYANKDVGVTSTLCYGIQIDSIMDFIKDEKNVTDSAREWGNYYGSECTITRTTAKFTKRNDTNHFEEWMTIPADGKNKEKYVNTLLTTGASDEFAVKNIFDLAGNVEEWIMETYYYEEPDYGLGFSTIYYGRFCFGGNCFFIDHDGLGDGSFYYAPSMCEELRSFRPALYIK